MWTDDLPAALQAKVAALVQAQPDAAPVLAELHGHLSKKRKTDKPKPKPKPTNGAAAPPPGPAVPVQRVSEHKLVILTPVSASEVIFELPSLSFSSPTRRKLNFVFHLYIDNNTPLPVLSVVNPTTGVPEFSLTSLQSAVKLCVLLPILGNTTVPLKKDTAMLCFWLHQQALPDPARDEPIICVLNLDLVKKQLVKDGKIPPNAEALVAHVDATNDAIRPINELIIDFLQRQFSLCGVKLVNYLPSTNPQKNTLNQNDDNAICLSQRLNALNDLVAVSAYKGSKEGVLLFISVSDTAAYLVFGFRKPILLVSFADVSSVSYKDIARFTFTILLTVRSGDKEETLEFSMIDQKSHQAVDDFVKRMNIEDNSFDEKLKEKGAKEKDDAAAPEGDLPDEDEDEDETYTGAVEEGSDSDAEDYGSNASGSGSDSGSDSGSEDEDEDDNETEVKEE